MISHYPGSKNASGIIPFLINNIPYHTEYAEYFCGSAQLFRYKKKAKTTNILNDINPEIIAALKAEIGNKAALFSTNNAIAWLELDRPKKQQHKFIYLDPPYPFDSRKSKRPIYKYEMNQDQHLQLLTSIIKLDYNIMISTRENQLYDDILTLADWRKKTFNTIDRGGRATEVIYMNYQEPEILHQYDYLGEDRTRRQMVRRKVSAFSNKIDRLPEYEKHALIMELVKKESVIVNHFMSQHEATA